MSGMSCAGWNVKSLACMRRRNWDITAIALTIYTLLVLPFRAAFYWEYYRDLEMHHNVIEQLEVHSMLEKEHIMLMGAYRTQYCLFGA